MNNSVECKWTELIFDKSCKSENERLVSNSWWRRWWRQWALGRLDNVTKLLQRQRRDSQRNGVCRILSIGKPSVSFQRVYTGSEIRGYHPGKFFKSAASQSPSKNCPPAVGKIATRRLISRKILASVVNASSRRRRGLQQRYTLYMSNCQTYLCLMSIFASTMLSASVCRLSGINLSDFTSSAK